MRITVFLFTIFITIIVANNRIPAFAGESSILLDVEGGAGITTICLICKTERALTGHTQGQIQLNALFPIAQAGEGVIALGPYAGATFIQEIMRFSGGLLVSYERKKWSVFGKAGGAYSLQEMPRNRMGGYTYSGQSKETFDFGIGARYFLHNRSGGPYLGLEIGHNSNGNIGSTGNPGYDHVSFLIGFRF